MAFLRIAAFDIQDAPEDALEIWDDLVGSALRNNPDCSHVMVSRRGSTYATVSIWTSEERFHDWVESKPAQDVISTVMARVGMAEGLEPVFLFEGSIPDQG